MRTATSQYLNAASAAPLHPVAVEAMQAALEDGWADPARLTTESRRAAALLAAARAAMAELLDVESDEVTFTGSGVAALHAGVLGAVAGRSRTGQRLVHSAVEHSAVLHAARWHADRGGSVEIVGVDEFGRVGAAEFASAALVAGTAAAVLQSANHEVGTRQPLAEVAVHLAPFGVPLVVDATHDLARAVPDLGGQRAILIGDARMWGGPSGVGVLVVPRGSRWRNPWPDDEAEFGRGTGPVSIPAVVGAAAALRAVRAEAETTSARLNGYVERLRANVPVLVDDCVVLGHPTDRLPHILTFSCLHVDGESLLTELDRRGFSVSSGSSCTSDALTPSHVLAAMGALTSGNVRVSLHPGVTDDAIDAFLDVLPEVVRATRAQLPGTGGFSPATAVNAPTDGSVIDSRGKRCPLPILDLSKAWPDVPIGGVVTVLSDDPAAATDIAAWCRMREQEFVDASPRGEAAVAYRVRRLT